MALRCGLILTLILVGIKEKSEAVILPHLLRRVGLPVIWIRRTNSPTWMYFVLIYEYKPRERPSHIFRYYFCKVSNFTQSE